MASVDEVLQVLDDLESLSFYGLAHWQSELNELLEQIDHIATAKAPKAQDLALLERKEELLAAQCVLRKQMGAALEQPLTRRERPEAEKFLEAQLARLQSQAKAKAQGGVERLQKLLSTVRAAVPVPESKEVRDIEAQMKQADAVYQELEPIYAKWQAGRHSFKSNADLQSFKRRYEEAKKLRDAPERLEAALRRRRPVEPPGPPGPPAPGPWARRAVPAPVPKSSAVRVSRGAAAVALDAPKPKNSWSSGVTLAQRLQAEAVAKVREAQEVPAEDTDDDFFWEETVRPPPPPVPKAATASRSEDFVAKKSVPAKTLPQRAPLASLANGRRWGTEAEAESEEESKEAAPVQAETERSFAASAKKKSKRKKKEVEEEPQEAEPAASSSSWVKTLQAAFAESVLEDLLRRDAWGFDENEAQSRLASLSERLPLQSPLGLPLFGWSRFLALDLDGGPKRRSRRGESDAWLRLRHNVPRLSAFYLTIIFSLVLLHSLSHFGLLSWIMAAQVALLLLPTLPNFKASAQVRVLQLVHLLLWVFFVRSLWQMHIFVKIFLVAMLLGHSYSVREVRDSPEG